MKHKKSKKSPKAAVSIPIKRAVLEGRRYSATFPGNFFNIYLLITLAVYLLILLWLFFKIDNRSDSSSESLISFIPPAIILTFLFSLPIRIILKSGKN